MVGARRGQDVIVLVKGCRTVCGTPSASSIDAPRCPDRWMGGGRDGLKGMVAPDASARMRGSSCPQSPAGLKARSQSSACAPHAIGRRGGQKTGPRGGPPHTVGGPGGDRRPGLDEGGSAAVARSSKLGGDSAAVARDDRGGL